MITTCNLVAAGSHRGDAIVEEPDRLQVRSPRHHRCGVGPRILAVPTGTTSYPLTQAGIEQTLELVTHQRGIRPFAGDALLSTASSTRRLLPEGPPRPGVTASVCDRPLSTGL